MKTQQELEAMTDFELNRLTAELKGVYHSEFKEVVYGAIKREGVINVPTPVDYCNNWGDCGALIDECGITTKVARCTEFVAWFAMDSNKMGLSVLNKNDPKRAITIVYILIKQG